MKILFVSSIASNHTMRWVNALSELGHEVMLISIPEKKSNLKFISKKVKIKLLYFSKVPYAYILNVPELIYIFNKFKPDVVSCHFASGYGTLCRLAQIKPLLLSVWGSDVYDVPYRNSFYYNLVKRNLEYADNIASTSKAMALKTRELIKNSSKSITVTPFGVDTSIFCPTKYKNNRDEFRIGIVKYLEPIYDIDLLIDGFEIFTLNNIDKRIFLDIYGHGSLEKHLKEKVKHKRLEERIIFHDTIPNKEVPKALNSFDVFVNCSKKESFGVAVLEAMACQIPVIVTNTEGCNEIVDNRVNGIILSDRDPSSMAKAFQYMFDNPDIRNNMGFNGRKKVLKLYDWKNNVLIMEDLLQKTKDIGLIGRK